MKRTLFIASHSTLASGMADALKLFAGDNSNILTLNAYVDNKPIKEQISKIFSGFADDEEVIVLTDLLSGSVNQELFSYRNRQHTQIITGMNLALGLAVLLEPSDQYLTSSRINELVKQAQENLVYMNEYSVEASDDDE